MRIVIGIFFSFTLLLNGAVWAQTRPATEQAPGDKIQLLGADVLEVVKINGVEVRKVKRNVSFKQKDTYMYCDSAFLYPEANNIDAFGHVRITQGDTVTLTGDSLNYNGNAKYAKVRGNVLLQDKSTMLTTNSLDYNMNTSVAAYLNNGKIVDKDNTLTSQQGFYNTKTKLFSFKKNVLVVNPEYQVTSDTLQYSSTTKIVYLRSPSKIVGKERILYANAGEYNTLTQSSNFRGRAKADYGKYTLEGDTLIYDQVSEVGIARSNVEIVSKEDRITIYGDYARYSGKQGISRVYGNALMKNVDSSGDTLYLSADTLVSFDNKKALESQTQPKKPVAKIAKKKETKSKKEKIAPVKPVEAVAVKPSVDTLSGNASAKPTKILLAYHNVQIYRADLQGKCDSLSYNLSDSTIRFFRDPVLWSNNSQMEADSIYIQMANSKVDKMYLRVNSLVASEDSIHNFNQIKGRTLTAHFNKESKMENVYVEGNGESLFFALDEGDSLLVGMNRVECSKMVIKFLENKVNHISFISKPDALFVPPHELSEPDKRLKGFIWRIKEKPTEEEVVYKRKNKISKS